MAGFAALGKEDYNAALKHATDFLAKYGQHELAVDVTHVAAESNLQLSKFDEAEKLFAQLLQKNPKHADAEAWKIRQGLSLQLQKKYKEAIAALAAAAEADQDARGRGRNQLSRRHQPGRAEGVRRGRQVAAGVADGVVQRGGRPTTRCSSLAYASAQSDDRAQAKETLRKLIADFPQSKLLDRAHYRLGEYSFADGDMQTAAAEYALLAEKWPQSPLAPHALYGLGWAKVNEKQYADAEKALDKLVKDFAEHKLVPRARYARGIARQQLAKFEPAVEDVRAFLAGDPSETEKAEAQYVIGLCQVGLKQHAEAAATFEGLLKDSPKSSIADKAYYELAWALQSQDKKKEAAEAFAKVVEAQPDGPLAAESLFHVAEFAYDGKDYKSAAETIRHGDAEGRQVGPGREGGPQARLGPLPPGRFRRRPRGLRPAAGAVAQRTVRLRRGLHGGRVPLEAEEVQGGPGRLRRRQEAQQPRLRGAHDAALGPGPRADEAVEEGARQAGQGRQAVRRIELPARDPLRAGPRAAEPGQLAAANTLYEEVIAKTNTEVAAARSS